MVAGSDGENDEFYDIIDDDYESGNESADEQLQDIQAELEKQQDLRERAEAIEEEKQEQRLIEAAEKEAAARVLPTEKSGGRAATQLRTALKVHIDLDEIVRRHRVRVIEDKIFVGRGGTSIFAWN